MTERWYSLVQAVYVIAGVLFILSLAGLSHQKTARAGNTAGKIGMGLAVVDSKVADSHNRKPFPMKFTDEVRFGDEPCCWSACLSADPTTTPLTCPYVPVASPGQ